MEDDAIREEVRELFIEVVEDLDISVTPVHCNMVPLLGGHLEKWKNSHVTCIEHRKAKMKEIHYQTSIQWDSVDFSVERIQGHSEAMRTFSDKIGLKWHFHK